MSNNIIISDNETIPLPLSDQSEKSRKPKAYCKNSKTLNKEEKKFFASHLPFFLSEIIGDISKNKPFPDIFLNPHARERKTGRTKLYKNHAKTRITRRVLEKYFQRLDIDPGPLVTPFIPRWKLAMVVNILCYQLTPDKLKRPYYNALLIANRLLRGHRGMPKKLKKVDWDCREDWEELFKSLDGCICPNCGEIFINADADQLDPNWCEIKEGLNLDEYAAFSTK